MLSNSKHTKGYTSSTYMVLDSKKKAEIRRLVIQDQLIITAMGGVLAEQTEPGIFHRILDVGCGPGGWMLETAQMYPEMHLVGIDINLQMIEYAREQVQEGVRCALLDPDGCVTLRKSDSSAFIFTTIPGTGMPVAKEGWRGGHHGIWRPPTVTCLSRASVLALTTG